MLCIRFLALALALSTISVLVTQETARALPAGAACGTDVSCDKGLWCEPQEGACASQAGVCVSIPRLCIARKRSKNYHPVCGCNSKTYSSDCFRRAQRIAKLHDGKC